MVTSERRKFFKRQARAALLGDWVNQILAFFITSVCFVGINMLGSAMYALLSDIGAYTEYIGYFPSFYYVLSLFLTVPLICGVFRFEMLEFDGNKGTVGDVFFAFSSSEQLSRCYKIFFSFAVRFLPPFIPAFAVLYYAREIYAYDATLLHTELFGVDIAYFLLCTLFAVLFCAALVYNGGNLVGLYYAVRLDDEDIGACFLMGKAASRSSRGEISMLVLSFVPLFASSLFTFGLLFIIYTLPYFLLSFIYLSEYLYSSSFCCTDSTSNIYSKLFYGFPSAQTDAEAFDGENRSNPEAADGNGSAVNQ